VLLVSVPLIVPTEAGVVLKSRNEITGDASVALPLL